MGTGGGGFEENMGKFGWDGYWGAAYVAQSGDGWSTISEYFYGSTATDCWEGLQSNNGGGTLDVGQVVGLPAFVGLDLGAGGIQYDLICANVPAQKDLGVLAAPSGFSSQAIPACGFTAD